jgi:S1-C subfamily serine protease
MTDSVFQGLPVYSCFPGSPAERAGVKKGDVVVLANGQRVENMDQYVAARGLRTDRLEITVLRGPRMLEMIVDFTSPADLVRPGSQSAEISRTGS